MDPDFWHQRWRENRIGFHQDQPTPLLLKHWPTLGVQPGSRVFVPLAGKSMDLAWFAAQGYRVLGVELSQLAVEQFFTEHGLTPQITDTRYGRLYSACNIELICGDAFTLDAEALADCQAVFDRAALIALPPDLRRRYVSELHARLPRGTRGLLITLEYPQHEKEGPPFSVPENEVRDLYTHDWNIEVLERRDILATQQNFIDEGVTRLDTSCTGLKDPEQPTLSANFGHPLVLWRRRVFDVFSRVSRRCRQPSGAPPAHDVRPCSMIMLASVGERGFPDSPIAEDRRRQPRQLRPSLSPIKRTANVSVAVVALTGYGLPTPIDGFGVGWWQGSQRPDGKRAGDRTKIVSHFILPRSAPWRRCQRRCSRSSFFGAADTAKRDRQAPRLQPERRVCDDGPQAAIVC